MSTPLRNFGVGGQRGWSATKRRRLLQRLADQARLIAEENETKTS